MLQNENLKIYLYIEGAHYANYRLRALLFLKKVIKNIRQAELWQFFIVQ